MAEFFDTHRPISREVKARLRINHQRHGANDLATEARRRPPKFQFQPVLSGGDMHQNFTGIWETWMGISFPSTVAVDPVWSKNSIRLAARGRTRSSA